MRAWVNLAHRRGYLLEGAAADFLANRGAAAGDVLVVYRRSDSSPPVRYTYDTSTRTCIHA